MPDDAGVTNPRERSVGDLGCEPTPLVEVLVIGAGIAGLAGALTLARARRSVLVVDSGQPRNALAEYSHAYLTRDGMPPRELLEIGRSEVRRYGGEIIDGTVTALSRLPEGGGFLVTLAGGMSVKACKVLLASGLVDKLPDIPGLRARWGRDVVHCPHCFGWEMRDQRLGVLATSPLAAMQALMWRQWSSDIVLFAHTVPAPTGELAEQLAARGIRVIASEVTGVEVTADRLSGVRLRSGHVIERSVLIIAPQFEAQRALLGSLGDTIPRPPRGSSRVMPGLPPWPTGITGVWVAGNAADPNAGFAQAAASGVAAGAEIDACLNAEDTARAVLAWRAQAK